MSYSGAFDLEYLGNLSEVEFPDAIGIYYQGEHCGTATKWNSNTPNNVQRYSFTMRVPFRFDSYDSESRSQTLTFFDNSSDSSARATYNNISYSFSIGTESFTLQSSNQFPYRDRDYWISNVALVNIDEDGIDNFSAIEDASLSESSASGVPYVYTVVYSRTATPNNPPRNSTYDYKIDFTVENYSAELDLTAKKTVDGGTPDQSYEFELLDADGNVLQTKQSDAEGGVAFDAIYYGNDDLGAEHTYQVREKAGSDEAIDYDDSVYTVTVTPHWDDPDDPSEVVVEPTITKDGEEVSSIAFDNKRKAAEPAAPEPAEPKAAAPEAIPSTGDSPEPALLSVMLASAAACIGMGLRGRRQE